MKTALTIDAIVDRARFGSAAREWDGLVRSQARPRLHLSSGWIAAWWDCLGADGEIRLVTVRRGGRIVAAAPLYLRRRRFGGIELPVARLLGNVFAARSDILVAAGCEPAVDLMVDYLRGLDWWLLDTGRVPADSPGIGMFASAAQVLVSHRTSRHRLGVPRIDLAGDWPAFLAGRSANFRRSIRRAERASWSLRMARFPEDFAEVERLFGFILAVSRQTWKHKAGTSLAADADAWRFFSRVMTGAAGCGALHARLLLDGEAPVAFIVGVRFAGTLYALKLGYDEAYAKVGPGLRVLAALVHDAFGLDTVRAIDLDCVAGKDDYKVRWATEIETFEESYFFRGHFGGAMLGRAHALARRVRHLLGRAAHAAPVGA